MTAHAKLPPSSASRWTTCTASVAFVDELRAQGLIPADSSSAYADEGTEAHDLAAAMLTGAPLPQAKDPETLANVTAYVEWVRSWHRKATKQTLWVERRIELFYLPGQYGTTDATVWGKSFIFVGDYKNGVGVSVDAVENKQLAIYAESVIREIELVMDVRGDMPVILGIFQPRDRNNPEPVRTWELTRTQLADFCADIDYKAAVVLGTEKNITTAFNADPEKQCRFCPAKPACKHYANFGLTAIVESVDKLPALVLPAPDAITREQRQLIIAAKKPIADFIAAVEEQETAELLAGAAPMKFKLVAGKSNRAWADETAAEKLLRNYLKAEQVRPPSDVISPAQAEKLLKGVETSTRFENAFEKLITKPEGKPTLVPVDDKRPALQLTKADGLSAVPSIDDV